MAVLGLLPKLQKSKVLFPFSLSSQEVQIGRLSVYGMGAGSYV